jgi:hypothetical protein
MANVLRGGFRFSRMKTGAKQYQPFNGYVLTSNAAGIFFGDPVKRVSTGDFVVAAAGDAIAGFCCGVEQYQGTDGVLRKGGQFLPVTTTFTGGLGSDTASIIRIIPAADVIMECIANAATATTLAAWLAFVGENVDVSMATAGNTTTGISGAALASAGHAVTNSLVFRIEDVVRRPDVDYASAGVPLLVSVNLSQEVPYVILGT